MNGNASVNSSRLVQADRGEERFEGSRVSCNRRRPQLSESLLQHSERTIPSKRPPQKINFVYNKEDDNSVHNYHTTNYIVEKLIVKPQEMNIFIRPEE